MNAKMIWSWCNTTEYG